MNSEVDRSASNIEKMSEHSVNNNLYSEFQDCIQVEEIIEIENSDSCIQTNNENKTLNKPLNQTVPVSDKNGSLFTNTNKSQNTVWQSIFI